MDNLIKLTTLLSNLVVIAIFFVIVKTVDPFAATETEEAQEETQEEESKQEIELERNRLIDLWTSQGLTNIDQLIGQGEEAISNKESTNSDLRSIAEKSNKAANLISYIQEEYSDYHRENFKYEFVQQAVSPAHDKYVKKGNALKRIRNESYFLLGERFEAKGDLGRAFFYYRDAYRLTSFEDRAKEKEGLRYRAEQKMKNLLGITDIESYVTW
jgi:hypothetical protein